MASKIIDDIKYEMSKLLEDMPAEVKTTEAPSFIINKEEAFVDPEIICLCQLRLLKEQATSRELTLEETKKVEILVKTLQIIKGKGKEDKPETTKMSTDELIRALNGNQETN